MKFGEAEAIAIADRVLFDRTGEHLTDLETIVLQGSWQQKKYHEIAQAANFNEDYIRGTIGQELWRKLSDALGERVEKRNFRKALERCWQEWQESPTPATPKATQPREPSLDPLELERSHIESLLYETLSQPGCLIRIKAPWQMGKTTLMAKGLRFRAERGDRVVRLSLRLAEAADFASLENFLLWFCTSIAAILGEENCIEQHWRSKLGNNKVKFMTYLEQYLLSPDTYLVIALDDLDRLFPYAQIAGDFLGILRTLHEQAKTRKIWQQLRLVLVHTEVYDRLEINQSPFNVGTQIEVTEFDATEVRELAKLHGLNWDDAQVQSLMDFVGGHPYLLQQTFHHLARGDRSLAQIKATSATESGIYGNHLRRYQRHLQQLPPETSAVLKQSAIASDPIQFQSSSEKQQAQRLHNLGLLRVQNHCAAPRNQLYRQYFRALLEDF